MSSTTNITGRFPIVTKFPGVSGKKITLIFGFSGISSAEFSGKTNNTTYKITHSWQSQNDLMVKVDDGSMCQFVPWYQFSSQIGYPNFFSAQGLFVNTHREGIATAIYLYARQILAEQGLLISPSENLTPSGQALWSAFDPTIKWLSVPTTGGYQPDLTGRSAP